MEILMKFLLRVLFTEMTKNVILRKLILDLAKEKKKKHFEKKGAIIPKFGNNDKT